MKLNEIKAGDLIAIAYVDRFNMPCLSYEKVQEINIELGYIKFTSREMWYIFAEIQKDRVKYINVAGNLLAIKFLSHYENTNEYTIWIQDM